MRSEDSRLSVKASEMSVILGLGGSDISYGPIIWPHHVLELCHSSGGTALCCVSTRPQWAVLRILSPNLTQLYQYCLVCRQRSLSGAMSGFVLGICRYLRRQ